MANSNHVVRKIKGFISNWAQTREDFQKIIDNYPRPWFESEDDAYLTLQEVIKYIDELPATMQLDARFKFLRYDIDQLFTIECPSCRSFWLLQRYKVIEPILNKPIYDYLTKIDKV